MFKRWTYSLAVCGFSLATIAGALGWLDGPGAGCTLYYDVDGSGCFSYSCAGDCGVQGGHCGLDGQLDEGLMTYWCECGGSEVTGARCRANVKTGPAPWRRPITVTCTTTNCAYGCVDNTPGAPGGGGSGSQPVCRCPGS